jgi:hypothetical protein
VKKRILEKEDNIKIKILNKGDENLECGNVHSLKIIEQDSVNTCYFRQVLCNIKRYPVRLKSVVYGGYLFLSTRTCIGYNLPIYFVKKLSINYRFRNSVKYEENLVN